MSRITSQNFHIYTKAYLDRIEQIEYKARKLLNAYAIETVWGPFVPVTAYQSFRAAIDQLEEAYYQVRDEILANYATIMREVLENYVKAAGQAYRILNKVNPEALSERERRREIYYLGSARRKIRKMLPTPDDIRDTFAFEISPTYIDLPLLAGEDADGTTALSLVEKPTIEDVTPEEQRELRWRKESTRERQQMMRAMNEDVVRKAREQKEQRIDAFFSAVITQVRGLLYDATVNVLAALAKHETLPPRSVVQLKNLTANLQLLNFYGDKDVERAMVLIETLIDRPREDRDLELIEQRLRQIATVMRSTLLPLEYEFREDRLADSDDPGERAKALVELEKRELARVPRRPSREGVREARMSLGFTLPSWDEAREERLVDEAPVSVSLAAEEREGRAW